MVMIDRGLEQRRFIAALGIALSFLLAEMAPALAGQGTDSSSSPASVFIPFTECTTIQDYHQSPPTVQLFVPGTGTLPTPIDTGSTGLLLSSNLIPNYASLKSGQTAVPGYQFLTSSKRLYVGTWVPLKVTFFDTRSNPVATSSVNVLGVENAGKCLIGNGTQVTNDGQCACKPGTAGACLDPGSGQLITCPPSGTCTLPSAYSQNISYMGVGFGREYNLQPYGTPDKNALIHITEINGQPVASNFVQGYIIDPLGVTVGLTADNQAGFNFIYLSHSPTVPSDWLEIPMSVQIAQTSSLSSPSSSPLKCQGGPMTTPFFVGSTLVDTGIDQSYISVPPRLCIQKPPAQVGGPDVLADNSKVTVNLLDCPVGSSSCNQIAATYTYSLPYDPSTPWAPTRVIPDWPSPCQSPNCPFVNTGRHFLLRYQFLFDPSGRVGLKQITSQPGSGG